PPLSSHRDDLGSISEVGMRAMAHDKADRYPNAREMRTALLAAAQHSLPNFAARVASADITGQFGIPARARKEDATLDQHPTPTTPLAIGERVSAPPVETDRETRIKTHPSLRPDRRGPTWIALGVGAGALLVVGLGSWAVVHNMSSGEHPVAATPPAHA